MAKYSTTQVCSDLNEEAKKNIERLRHIWQPRGETVHYCLEQKMLGADDIDMGEYEEWANCINCSKRLWGFHIPANVLKYIRMKTTECPRG